jgi:hypothetical protein
LWYSNLKSRMLNTLAHPTASKISFNVDMSYLLDLIWSFTSWQSPHIHLFVQLLKVIFLNKYHYNCNILSYTYNSTNPTSHNFLNLSMDQRSLHVTISKRPSKYMCIIGQFNMNFMAFNAPKSFQTKRKIILVNS